MQGLSLRHAVASFDRSDRHDRRSRVQLAPGGRSMVPCSEWACGHWPAHMHSMWPDGLQEPCFMAKSEARSEAEAPLSTCTLPSAPKPRELRAEDIAELAFESPSRDCFRASLLPLLLRRVGADIAILTELEQSPEAQSVLGLSVDVVEDGRREYQRQPEELNALREALRTRSVVSAHSVFESRQLTHGNIFQCFRADVRVTSFVIAALALPDGTHPRHLVFARAGGRHFDAHDEQRLTRVVRTVALADSSLCPAPGHAHVATLGKALPHVLSSRQRELCFYLVHGYTNAEIAKACGLSANTVRNHLVRLFERFDVSNRTELVARLLSEPVGTSVPFANAATRVR